MRVSPRYYGRGLFLKDKAKDFEPKDEGKDVAVCPQDEDMSSRTHHYVQNCVASHWTLLKLFLL